MTLQANISNSTISTVLLVHHWYITHNLQLKNKLIELYTDSLYKNVNELTFHTSETVNSICMQYIIFVSLQHVTAVCGI